ncbi:tyrosine-protein phosphatase [Secundilactobacillus paracollinoides]|uniref:tyrosine-protein phosphatase n=1 Tax=Secundilactobacillus paracollinoides TaxID=240427 RepID=UPI00081BC874|nr:tyrosine-protein phosphatase [Secundilactobacillus paracollinoides]
MTRYNEAIPISGGLNCRDLGGHVARDGRTVKYHKLIRAGHLSELTPTGQQQLLDYGVTVDIDLRSSAELEQYPDLIPAGIDFIHFPCLDNDDTESTETVNELNQFYSSSAHSGYLRMLYVYRKLVINQHSQSAMRQVFTYLLAYGNDETVLFHCSAGKDRTGLTSLLILSALGVSLADVKQDYLLTNNFLVERLNQRISDAKQAHLNQNFISSIRGLSTVNEDYFDQAMTLINYEFGGIKAYLRDIVQLSDADIRQLRDTYLE